VSRSPLLVALGLSVGLSLLCCGVAGCGSVVDQNEPNDNLETATPLVIGTVLRGSIGSSGDGDIFKCDMSDPAASAPFWVELESDNSGDLEMQVGISLPDAWEGITWPGWQARTDGDVISLQGEAATGTLLIFISGTGGVDYTVRVTRE
jgi:hypothetical protein